MKELKITRKFIIKWSFVLNLILIFAMIIFFDIKSVLGVLVGGIMSIINFYLLSLSLQKAVKFSPTKAGAYVFVQYILRYILWFVVFYIALKRPDVNLITTIIGMLIVKFVVLVSNVFDCYPQSQECIRKEGN